MAIKKKSSRDTYRSNVKIRPLRQNGLEAQYQGLDITEVNIDHAGLAIIGRGGYQTRRDVRKVRKQYIVDVPRSEHYPTAELIFKQDVHNNNPFLRNNWETQTNDLSSLDTKTFRLTDQNSTVVTFQFHNNSNAANGAQIPFTTNKAVNIVDNKYSVRDLLSAITGSIEANFPEDTFSFKLFPKGTKETFGNGIGETQVEVLEDKVHITLNTVVNPPTTMNALLENPASYAYFDVTTNEFGNQQEQHEWRLNGYHKDNSNPRMFYEDIRVDTLQSVLPHSYRNSGSLFRQDQFSSGSDQLNYDANIGTKGTAGIAGDPTTKNRFDTHDSAEILIRQYPRREEIRGTYKDNFQWHEDPHYVLPDQQTWSLMSMYAEMYSSTLEEHISKMFSRSYVTDLYYEDHLLSGRVDVFDRLSRVFDLHNMLTFERHQYAVFTQYLDPLDDFVNLQQNRFPKEDCANRDIAFEDVTGTRAPLVGQDTIFDSRGDTIYSRYSMNFFSGLPADGDYVKLRFGNGFLSPVTLEIRYNHGGTHNNAVKAVNFSTDEFLLEIDVDQAGWVNDTLALFIAQKLTAWTTTPVNGILLNDYTIIADTSGAGEGYGNTHEHVIITATNPGAGYDITNLDNQETGNYVSYPQDYGRRVSGVDSLWARDNSMMFIDYFDQEPLDSHDYIEEERYTRIDDEMLVFLTALDYDNDNNSSTPNIPTGRSTFIDRREWQQSAYVYTSTGFISSQTSGQDGIIYREMKR